MIQKIDQKNVLNKFLTIKCVCADYIAQIFPPITEPNVQTIPAETADPKIYFFDD